MTRRTRAQTKARQMAAATAKPKSHEFVPGNNTHPASHNASEATMADIVRDEKTVSPTAPVTSAVDADNGEVKECPVCDRPNNAERYRVQCKKCTKWYHFSCAKVSDDVAITDMFTCLACIPRKPVPPPSSVGRSSTSSIRRARLARELELLEEERRMLEEAQREQMERDKLINEKAAKEKIERDRQYLAKKRDLLNQQEEEDEIASLRSHRSSRSSAKRVEDWVVKQVKSTSHTGSGVVEETFKPFDPTHRAVANSVAAPAKQQTSTPISYEVLQPFHVEHEQTKQDDIHLTAGSIVAGEHELEGAVGGDVISMVNLQSLRNILDVSKPHVSRTGTIPKLARRTVVPYDQWQSETGIRRKMNELESRHQQDIEMRRIREQDLVQQIHQLQLQKDADVEHVRNQEEDKRKQLQQIADRQTAMKVQRQQELELRDAELNRQRASEQQLKRQLESIQQQQQEKQQAPSTKPDLNVPRRLQQKQPVQPAVIQPEGPSGNSRFDVNSCPVSFASPVSRVINKDPQPMPPMHDYQPSLYSTPIGGRSSYSVPSTPTLIPSPIPSHVGDYLPDPANPVIDDTGMQQRVFLPTQQQLAARQVLSKELPIFSGDPIDWPLFISSYQHSSEACGFSDFENLLRLQRALKGAARDAVSSFLLHPSTLPQVMSTLQILFGRPEQIVHTMVTKIRATPPPKSDKLETLVSFGLTVQNLCGHLKAVGLDWHLSNPTLLQELVDKLPANVKFNWAMYQQQFAVVDLNVFSEYMARVTSATSSVIVSSIQQSNPKDDRTRAKEKAYVNAHTTTEQDESTVTHGDKEAEGKERFVNLSAKKTEEVRKCPACNAPSHQAGECSKFKGLTLDNRWSIVKEHKLCRRCLKAHLRWPCKGDPCGVNGCQKLHHQLLHYEPSTDSTTTEQTTNATVTIHHESCPLTLFRVLPVTLYGKYGEVNTLAFLDDGSSVTLVDRTIADTLGLDGKTEPLCIQWTSGINKTISDARIVQMEISAQGSSKRFKLGSAFTVNGLGLPEQSLNFDEIADRYQHLQKLPVQSFKSAKPGILIGLNNSHLLATLKLREGHAQEPIASKTRIGWAVYGSIRGGDQLQHRQMHICAQTADADLTEYVREFFSLESLGIALAPNLEGAEEERARKILEETTVRTESGKFETGLLWKHDYIELPDSWPMAEKRLKCLEKRLQKYPTLYETVRKQIAEFLFKGYVHEATEEELKSFDLRRTWYLPLGIVMNPNKPGKVRLIWDAAAQVEGISLNDQLLKGPDLLTSLLAVLFQFREREVAISADIMEMFLQILIRLVDRSALFLWRDFPDCPIKVMVTDVAVFGASCSPVQSQFVKNLNATEHEEMFPRAAAAIKNKHYVDDYLDSVDTIEEAVQIATDVSMVHSKADFFIRNWMSNRPEVLKRIGEVDPAAVKRFAVGKDCKLERLLGMIWSPEDDVFSFDLCLREEIRLLIDGEVIPSKRELLSVVMSLYDPLGLVSAFVIHGKVLVQDTWRANIGWDDKIPSEIFCRWNQWLEVLREMTKLKISRCYFPGYDPVSYDTLQLHIFVDASEQAFAAVAYFRIVDRGEVRCTLVSSKTKVAPLRTLSMPRLELMAALIGARLRKSIEDHHSVKITRTFFWSDSTTVVAWIKSDSRRYRQFVAFRVNEILSLSTVDEWNWIGTRTNVADEATKWGKGPSTDSESRWYRGPEFLYDKAGVWLGEIVEDTNEELRPALVCPHVIVEPTIEFERFSKFERLKRCIAYVHRFINNLRRTSTDGGRETARELSREELQQAEFTLWKLVQSEAYPDEVTTMKRNLEPGTTKKLLESSSKIANLPPTLDDHGILRVDSRIGAAEYLPFDTRYPIILPRGHRVTELLLDWYHRRFRHANDETVVNEVRLKFYIPQLRTRVRMTKARCMWCRVHKCVPVIPKMGPLPAVRLTPFVRAFTFVGVDYFGPYLVKIGRSVAKRWGVVFTCLTIRAIHVEVASSLTTDSCKKAIRRFIARRGAPQEIYSDNGTNFVGVSRELAEETKEINAELSSTFTDTYTQWRFNPPSAPHMGGCWERMVRSIKSALGAIPTERKLDDESLTTLFAEAEKMINSRPLTFVALETSDQEAITPNHFLLLSSTGVQQPVKEPVSEGESLRSSWNMLQYTLDTIWRRWITEYLPTITRRTKWFQNVRPIKEGELVVIADEKVRNRWLRGRVVRTFPGKDGTVRQAEVMTSSGILRRPVVKLALLDVEPEDDAKAETVAT